MFFQQLALKNGTDFPMNMSRFVVDGVDGIRELAAVSKVLCTNSQRYPKHTTSAEQRTQTLKTKNLYCVDFYQAISMISSIWRAIKCAVFLVAGLRLVSFHTVLRKQTIFRVYHRLHGFHR